jgi:hypothetical protein
MLVRAKNAMKTIKKPIFFIKFVNLGAKLQKKS